MFSFEHTLYLAGLLAILPLAALFFGVLRWKKKARMALGDEPLISRLMANYSATRFRTKFELLCGVIALLVVAVANPRRAMPGEPENRAGIDVMIALDVSKSMWAEDTKPSRLEAAKQFTNKLLTNISNNRVGLVLFAGRAFLQMPLTPDLNVAGLYISNASPESVPVQGTVVSDALQLCRSSLNTKEKKFKAVVLISDGEDHDPKTEEIVQQMADEGIIVYTVGVGSVQGAPIKEPGAQTFKMDAQGKTVISKLDEGALMQIAQATGGAYVHLGNTATTATGIAKRLNAMEQKGIEGAADTRRYSSWYLLFVLLALLVLTAEIFIPETKKKTA